jgi:hypothetical protein
MTFNRRQGRPTNFGAYNTLRHHSAASQVLLFEHEKAPIAARRTPGPTRAPALATPSHTPPASAPLAADQEPKGFTVR